MPPQLERNRRTGFPARRPMIDGQECPSYVPVARDSSITSSSINAAGNYTEQYARIENIRDAWESLPIDWLSTTERSELDRLRNPNRREAWLGGRWLGKELIRRACAVSTNNLASIEILSRNAAGKSIRPQVMIDNRPAVVCLSISHSHRGILAALTTCAGATIGVDLAIPGPLKPGFLRTWFTAAEREELNESDARQVAEHWAIKEAVYKACNAGESFAPRNIEVFRSAEGLPRCYYRGSGLSHCSDIQVREIDGHVAVAAILTPHKRQ